MFKENEHPRDADGKFTDGNGEKSVEEIAKEIFPHLRDQRTNKTHMLYLTIVKDGFSF